MDFRKKQQIFPYTKLTDWFYNWEKSVYSAVRSQSFNIIQIYHGFLGTTEFVFDSAYSVPSISKGVSSHYECGTAVTQRSQLRSVLGRSAEAQSVKICH
jgi:hypothetical protein